MCMEVFESAAENDWVGLSSFHLPDTSHVTARWIHLHFDALISSLANAPLSCNPLHSSTCTTCLLQNTQKLQRIDVTNCVPGSSPEGQTIIETTLVLRVRQRVDTRTRMQLKICSFAQGPRPSRHGPTANLRV